MLRRLPRDVGLRGMGARHLPRAMHALRHHRRHVPSDRDGGGPRRGGAWRWEDNTEMSLEQLGATGRRWGAWAKAPDGKYTGVPIVGARCSLLQVPATTLGGDLPTKAKKGAAPRQDSEGRRRVSHHLRRAALRSPLGGGSGLLRGCKSHRGARRVATAPASRTPRSFLCARQGAQVREGRARAAPSSAPHGVSSCAPRRATGCDGSPRCTPRRTST